MTRQQTALHILAFHTFWAEKATVTQIWMTDTLH